ncbi:hypothetical protein HUE87_10560 [Candidatus Sulfurimonas marisnigri]|uniref:Uncharacterized protein n=1 Tax=Candidatus Sulfurimonas marisnigri TaxID=2740405 RepID=A0A7S7LYA3_9BACT|nr:hypothetical protein [Candidatus Sulfurimonas marisnigri]QOY53525.1 hypothetical protein HUE87_10560 [Candidatus Sulfurimonas marisnigri]
MSRQENKDETRAKKYLQTLEYTKLEHEPLGNVTPDFLLDNKIAVEVRRLNRNYIDSDKLIRIENFEIHLIKKVKKIISIFQHTDYKNSAYISITLSKPLEVESKAGVIKRIKKVLKTHTHKIHKKKSYKVSEYLKITFTPIKKKSVQYIFSDCNNDYLWIVNELHKNIQLVIDEKNKKISKNFNLFDKWWLILVDSIVYGLDNDDFKALKKIKLKKRKFSKVLILSSKGKIKTFKF